MATSVFMAGVEHLSLQTSPARGDNVADAFRITTDERFILSLIPEHCRPLLGEIELSSLRSGRPVAYTKATGLDVHTQAEASGKLANWLQLVTVFLQHIWFIKDNAASLELGYLFWPEAGGTITTRNFLGLVFTEADLSLTDRHLSLDEFRHTRELFQKNVTEPALAGRQTTKASRLQRAQYFVQSARMASHVPVKIANYCTALEALFSNDTSELTHKLSERVGWFIGTDGHSRADIFQRVKKAYGIRSKVVHGSTDWGRDTDVAVETSRFLDALLRNAFSRIRSTQAIEDLFTSDGDAAKRRHEDYLLGLVLGNSSLAL